MDGGTILGGCGTVYPCARTWSSRFKLTPVLAIHLCRILLFSGNSELLYVHRFFLNPKIRHGRQQCLVFDICSSLETWTVLGGGGEGGTVGGWRLDKMPQSVLQFRFQTTV